MKCPACKQNIPDNSIRCPHCNTRAGIVCKKCGTVNPILQMTCKNCGNELLKLCPQCKAVNFPEAENCRKCGVSFIKSQELEQVSLVEESEQVLDVQSQDEIVEEPIEETEQLQENSLIEDTNEQDEQLQDSENNIEGDVHTEISEEDLSYDMPSQEGMLSQEDAKNALIEGILSENKKLFSLSGEKGIGKSIVLKSAMYELEQNHIAWLYGRCTQFSQLTGGGLIQDFLLNVFNLANFCIYNPQFQKDAFQFFSNEFPQMSNQEIFDLINFLYPHIDGTFEELLSNKTKMFAFLEKIFDKIMSSTKCVIVIDNFELIDAFSYEFLMKYLKKTEVWEKLKLIAIYNEVRPVKGYFYFTEYAEEDIYQDITIAPFSRSQTVAFLEAKQNSKKDYPTFLDEEISQIYRLSKGNPAFFEQIFALKNDCERSNQPFELSRHISGIVNQRLALLSYLYPQAYSLLICASILGEKINLSIMQEVFDLEFDTFKQIIDYLVMNDYIVPLSDIYYEFKSLTLWSCVLEKAKLDEKYTEINERIYDFLSRFTLNSIAVLGVIAQNLKKTELSLAIWTKNTRLTAYTGDISLYAISQKQCLALINEMDEVDTLKIRYNISERLGKLLTYTNPKDAMEFLPDAINYAKNTENLSMEIELLSYLSTCCRLTGNYYGEVECVDTVLEKAPNMERLESALLKCTKLKALLAIGNCGQIVNMIDNDILPVFDEFFNAKPDNQDTKVAFVFETWVKTYLILAQALTLQGDSRAFEVLTILFEIIENNKIEDKLFIGKCKLTLALANSIKGNFEISEQLLTETLNLEREKIMDNEMIIHWNFVDIVNKFLNRRYDNIQEELFQIVTFANNNGDNFTKNILKVLLGKYFKDIDNARQAMDIYNDRIVYFAKEKMALGALITWFLIADVALILEGPDSTIEIASQALEVANNPKVNNYYFTILLKMVLSKAFIIKSDFDSAKMHIETAIKIAKKFELTDMLARLYLMYGKYFHEIGLMKSEKQQQYLVASAKMYVAAAVLTKKTKNKYVYSNIQKAQHTLVSFCQVNDIKLKK